MAAGELDNQVSVALTVRAKAEGVTKILAIYRMEDIETIKAAYEASLNEKVEFLRVRTALFPLPAAFCRLCLLVQLALESECAGRGCTVRRITTSAGGPRRTSKRWRGSSAASGHSRAHPHLRPHFPYRLSLLSRSSCAWKG